MWSYDEILRKESSVNNNRFLEQISAFAFPYLALSSKPLPYRWNGQHLSPFHQLAPSGPATLGIVASQLTGQG